MPNVFTKKKNTSNVHKTRLTSQQRDNEQALTKPNSVNSVPSKSKRRVRGKDNSAFRAGKNAPDYRS